MVKLLLVASSPSEEIMLAALSSIGKTSSLFEEEEVSLEDDASEEISLELERPSLDDESSEDLVSILQEVRIKPRSSRDILFFLMTLFYTRLDEKENTIVICDFVIIFIANWYSIVIITFFGDFICFSNGNDFDC